MPKDKQKDDRFKQFGTVSFTEISKVNDFIDHLHDGRIMGTRCNDCDQSFFPPRADCHKCLTSNMSWFEVSGTGTLVTFSRLAFAPLRFKEDLPYTIALVDFDGLQVFGRIAHSVEANQLKAGMPLRCEANSLPNGQINYVFSTA